MASVDAKFDTGDVLTIRGKDYEVTKAGSVHSSFSGNTRIVDIQEYREKKSKAV